jgi:hypothetical protein
MQVANQANMAAATAATVALVKVSEGVRLGADAGQESRHDGKGTGTNELHGRSAPLWGQEWDRWLVKFSSPSRFISPNPAGV